MEKPNKVFKNSIIWGIVYLIFSASLSVHEGVKFLYAILMQFLPGITFPISTSFFILNKDESKKMKNYFHLIGSVAIYYSSVWIFSREGYFKYSPIMAGFLGSFLYLAMSKYLILENLMWNTILKTAFLSGAGFVILFFIPKGNGGFDLGISILIWTLVNGKVIGNEIKKFNRQQCV